MSEVMEVLLLSRICLSEDISSDKHSQRSYSERARVDQTNGPFRGKLTRPISKEKYCPRACSGKENFIFELFVNKSMNGQYLVIAMHYVIY